MPKVIGGIGLVMGTVIHVIIPAASWRLRCLQSSSGHVLVMHSARSALVAVVSGGESALVCL